MKRRAIPSSSLAFLDVMFCGFGAVVLLVLILNHDTVEARNATFSDLRTEVINRQQTVLLGEQQLNKMRDDLASTDEALLATRSKTEQLRQVIHDLQNTITGLTKSTQASRTHIKALSADLKRLDNQKSQLNITALNQPTQANKILSRTGDGDRQYLTGLKVGGKRILILLDTSASMLDETIVNIVRRRNMSTAQKLRAPKWQRSLATMDWLVSQLPENSRFQLYGFNTRANIALRGRTGQWLNASNKADVEAAVRALKNIEPGGGTSLYHAFAVAKTLSPPPDNILLITDGLPTQGQQTPTGSTVTAEQRLSHFIEATQSLPAGIPVNTILMPMEGDAWAAAAFWRLAVDTHGSFMTPARDWP